MIATCASKPFEAKPATHAARGMCGDPGKREPRPWRCGPNDFLDDGPRGLDRVQVRRVRRQVLHAVERRTVLFHLLERVDRVAYAIGALVVLRDARSPAGRPSQREVADAVLGESAAGIAGLTREDLELLMTNSTRSSTR
jgi:hypothetical protein